MTNIGTALQAIEWSLAAGDIDVHEFLVGWQHGDVSAWPEYIAWLGKQPVDTARSLIPITDDHEWSFDGYDETTDLTITQSAYFEFGDNHIVALGELNYPNQWDDQAFRAAEAALTNQIEIISEAASLLDWLAEAERDMTDDELPQILRKMLRADMNMRAVYPALKLHPVTFDRIGAGTVMRSAVAGAAAMMPWQPIGTAPETGPYLVFGTLDGESVARAYISENGVRSGGRFAVEQGSVYLEPSYGIAVAWMPLPTM